MKVCPGERGRHIPEHKVGEMPERCTTCQREWAHKVRGRPVREEAVSPWVRRADEYDLPVAISGTPERAR